jgi:hypothetical protein
VRGAEGGLSVRAAQPPAARALAARTLAVLAVLASFLAAPSPARAQPEFVAAAREIDRQVFLEDAPIWLCNASSAERSVNDAPWLLTGRTPGGEALRFPRRAMPVEGERAIPGNRATQLARLVAAPRLPSDHLNLIAPDAPLGLPYGAYELRLAGADSARVLARFTVVPARGSEAMVRAALSRARRLLDAGRVEEACRLYEGVLERYPRTAYRNAVYVGLWDTRRFNRFAKEPELWMEEVFAHFHDTGFGVFAIDRYANTQGRQESLTILRRMAGIYTDTRMARAAAGWF